jgi:hypothetical protein
MIYCIPSLHILIYKLPQIHEFYCLYTTYSEGRQRLPRIHELFFYRLVGLYHPKHIGSTGILMGNIHI